MAYGKRTEGMQAIKAAAVMPSLTLALLLAAHAR